LELELLLIANAPSDVPLQFLKLLLVLTMHLFYTNNKFAMLTLQVVAHHGVINCRGLLNKGEIGL
jgi:hypothetical protein